MPKFAIVPLGGLVGVGVGYLIAKALKKEGDCWASAIGLCWVLYLIGIFLIGSWTIATILSFIGGVLPFLLSK